MAGLLESLRAAASPGFLLLLLQRDCLGCAELCCCVVLCCVVLAKQVCVTDLGSVLGACHRKGSCVLSVDSVWS